MEAIITIGISGSGKSTWANEFIKENKNYTIVERDKIRSTIQDIEKDYVVWSKWSWKNEKLVDEKQSELLNNCFEDGRNIIIPDTNLSPKTRKYFEDLFEQHKYKIKYKWFDIELDEAIKRDSLRKYPVGKEVIKTQYKKYSQLPHPEGWSFKSLS